MIAVWKRLGENAVCFPVPVLVRRRRQVILLSCRLLRVRAVALVTRNVLEMHLYHVHRIRQLAGPPVRHRCREVYSYIATQLLISVKRKVVLGKFYVPKVLVQQSTDSVQVLVARGVVVVVVLGRYASAVVIQEILNRVANDVRPFQEHVRIIVIAVVLLLALFDALLLVKLFSASKQSHVFCVRALLDAVPAFHFSVCLVVHVLLGLNVRGQRVCALVRRVERRMRVQIRVI